MGGEWLNVDWITISTLGNFSGVVFVVTLISQYLKNALDQIWHLPTRLVVLFLSWMVLMGHRFIISGSLTFEALFLDFLNGFLVALTAMGAYSVAKDNLNWK